MAEATPAMVCRLVARIHELEDEVAELRQQAEATVTVKHEAVQEPPKIKSEVQDVSMDGLTGPLLVPDPSEGVSIAPLEQFVAEAGSTGSSGAPDPIGARRSPPDLNNPAAAVACSSATQCNSDIAQVETDPKTSKPKTTPASFRSADRERQSEEDDSTGARRRSSAITNFLPIESWYLGHKHFDEPYHLTWAHGKMMIRSGEALGPPARHTEEVDVGVLAKTIYYVEPTESYPNKVFVLATFEQLKKKPGTTKPVGTQFSQYFKQGAPRGMGEIIIKFNSESPAWADTTYKAFVDWIKPQVQERELMRGKAGDSKWSLADRLAQLADSRVRREPDGLPKAVSSTPKSSAVPGLPPLKDWSPPPPPWPFNDQSPSTSSGSKRRVEGETDRSRPRKQTKIAN